MRLSGRAGEGPGPARFRPGLALGAGAAPAQELPPVSLPAPQTEGGKPLMQALRLRATARAFAPDPLSPQTLANLLWAAWGINRPQEGKRTAPSTRNWQEIDVVVLNATGAYLYDAAVNALKPLAVGDHRALAGTQDFVKDAPVTLVLVADTARMQGGPDTQAYAYADPPSSARTSTSSAPPRAWPRASGRRSIARPSPGR